MEILHGTLVTYEMRIDRYVGYSNREASFKSTKNSRNKELKIEWTLCDKSDEEEEKFVKKLKRRTGKNKGKLPFKCFSHGRLGPYAKRCLFGENKIFHKKNIYSKEDINSLEESDAVWALILQTNP